MVHIFKFNIKTPLEVKMNLGILKGPINAWMADDTLPEQCTYGLTEIGCADENHLRRPRWKTNLKQNSKQRLNITKQCGIIPKQPATAVQFINDNGPLISSINDLGFEFVVWMADGWRRGTDVTACKIREFEIDNLFHGQLREVADIEYSNYVAFFIVNPQIPDGDEADWISDVCSESD